MPSKNRIWWLGLLQGEAPALGASQGEANGVLGWTYPEKGEGSLTIE